MPFDPVKIPQNVYVEDRVIGPVSLRQIFMLLGGGGVSYVIWSVLKAAGVINMAAVGVALIPTIIMVLFAFVKIHEISLFRFCMLQIEQNQKPAKRYWQPRTGIAVRLQKSMEHQEEEENDDTKKNASGIDELSSMLDSQVLKTTTKTPAPTRAS